MKIRDKNDLVTNSKECFTNHKEERYPCKTHPCPYTHRNKKNNAKGRLRQHRTDRGGKHLACCTTGSQSRLANDDGTWLCCRSLACLRGVTDGGGTPDVDADRPNLQLTLGSVKKRERSHIS